MAQHPEEAVWLPRARAFAPGLLPPPGHRTSRAQENWGGLGEDTLQDSVRNTV